MDNLTDSSDLTPAIQLRDKGKYKEAREWLVNRLKKTPNEIEALCLSAHVLLLENQEEEAEKILAVATALNGKNPSVQLNQARLLLSKSEPQKALEKAVRANKLSPNNEESLIVLANCLAANNKRADAILIIEKILSIKPNHAEALATRAFFHIRAGDSKSAEKDAQLALAVKPHFTKVWALLSALKFQQKDFPEALRAIKEAYTRDPSNVTYITTYSEILRYAGKVDESIALLEKAANFSPKDEKIWMHLALTQQQNGDIQLAIITFRKALAINPNSIVVLNSLGRAASEIGDMKLASDCFKRAVEIEPGKVEHYCNYAAAVKELGRFKDAEKILRHGIKLDRNCAEAYGNYGAVLKELGRPSDAVTNLIRAINLDPNDAVFHYNLGVVYAELGRLEESIQCLSEATRINPGMSEAHKSLGKFLRKLGKTEEAIACSRKSVELNPSDPESYNYLANALSDAAQFEEASYWYGEALRLNSNYTEAHCNLGNLLRLMGRLDESELSLRRAIKLDGNNSAAFNNLGITLRKLGRLEESESVLKHAIDLDKNYAAALNNLGLTQLELGKLEEAKMSIKNALQLRPDNIAANRNLATIYASMNSLESEIRTLEKVLKLNPGRGDFRASVNLAICKFLQGDLQKSRSLLLPYAKSYPNDNAKFQNEEVYRRYLSKILSWHNRNTGRCCNDKSRNFLYVIGESHSLVSHKIQFSVANQMSEGKALLIKGCMLWHLGNPHPNQYKYQFRKVFQAIPESSNVLISIGEIDCRLNSGIVVHYKKNTNLELDAIVSSTVSSYIKYVLDCNLHCGHKLIIQGIPCPVIVPGKHKDPEVALLIETISQVNRALKYGSIKNGLDFLDLHQLTNNGDGASNRKWHLDNIHLSPDGMLHAWSNFLISN